MRIRHMTVTLLLMLSAFACKGDLSTTASRTGTSSTIELVVTVTGLDGTLILQNNGADDLTLTTDGEFAFAGKLVDNSDYVVTVNAQPEHQQCTIESGTGKVSGTESPAIVVSCAVIPKFSVGGTVSGLSGSVSLQNNGDATLVVSANGQFLFDTKQPAQTSYTVTISDQPDGQMCSVVNGTGQIDDADVSNVIVTCGADSFEISGTVTGLTGSVVLALNGADNLTVLANGTFAFTTPVAKQSVYAVTVVTQPVGQSCSLAHATGTISGADVTNVSVTCSANTYTLSGTVAGLTGTVVLQNNGGDNKSVAVNGAFSFNTALAPNANYAVTVLTQPLGQTCTVNSASGTMGTANVTNVGVQCSTNSYTVGGTISGLVGTVVLQNNGGDNETIVADGTFTFSTSVAHSAGYLVTVLTQPATVTCSLGNATGTMASANVSNVTVNCSPNQYTVSATLSGLVGTVVLQNNAGDNKTLTTNGTFTFDTALNSGDPYAVTVLTQPTGYSCSVSNDTGTISSTNVTNITVDCFIQSYALGGTVNGINLGSFSLDLNGSHFSTFYTDGPFTLVALPYGTSWNVAITGVSSGIECSFSSNDSGTMGAGDDLSLVIDCAIPQHEGTASVSNLTGTLELQNVNSSSNNFTSSGSSFSVGTFNHGDSYNFNIVQQPSGQICTITSGGSGFATNDFTVEIDCVNALAISGTTNGLNGTLTLDWSGVNSLTLSSNGPWSFPPTAAPGQSYTMFISSQPSGQSCDVSNGSGSSGNFGSSDITDMVVQCITTSLQLSGTMSGYSGATIQLSDGQGNTVQMMSDGGFTIPTTYQTGQNYSVVVDFGNCIVSNGSGIFAHDNVSNVIVTCAP